MKYRIGSFKELTGTPEGALRYYEKMGLMSPSRDRANDYRSYDELDLLRLVQIKQMSHFELSLNELPGESRGVSYASMCELLGKRRLALEETIKELYEKLARVKLHEEYFRQIHPGDLRVQKANIRGIYRLFVTDPQVAIHPETPEIVRRWLSYMPYTHSTMRIPLTELRADAEGPYPVHIGIGLLERYFSESGETLREPIRYTPPNMCIYGTIAVEDPRGISRKDIAPFFSYMSENGLIPQDDMFGWILYITREEDRPMYYISLRIEVA